MGRYRDGFTGKFFESNLSAISARSVRVSRFPFSAATSEGAGCAPQPCAQSISAPRAVQSLACHPVTTRAPVDARTPRLQHGPSVPCRIPMKPVIKCAC
ncbi:unnamed protein product, partial [Iphiclides podalirius]